MQFGLVRLIFKKSSKPNQTNAVWIGSVGAVNREIKKTTLILILPTCYKINIGHFILLFT